MDEEKELLDEFVADAKEHLETIEDDFLNLEKQKDNPDKAIIDKVFRAVHSIKGAAGFFGLTQISKLSHAMETLLSMIRSKEIRPESRFIDALLAGADYLAAMLDNIEYSNETDISDIHNRLTHLLDLELSPQVKEELNTPVALSDLKGHDIGFDLDAFTLKNISFDTFIYVLKYDLTEFEKAEKKHPIVLIRELLSSGEIMDAKIDTSSDDLRSGISETHLLYDVLYATIFSPDQIQKATGLSDEQIIHVKKELIDNKPEQISEKSNDDFLSAPQLELESENQHNFPEPIEDIPTILSSESSKNIRIHIDILDKLMTLAGELVLIRNQKLLSLSNSNPVSRSIAQRLDIITTELQENIMQIRMQPIGNLFGKFPHIVHELGCKLGKKIQINIKGNEAGLDKAILEALADPLVHLIRNCCDHGIEFPEQRRKAGKPETGNIELRAWHEAGQFNLEIKDDGQGINPEFIRNRVLEKGFKTKEEINNLNDKEILSLILLPGFSTSDQISDISGRGVGMDVVKTSIEKLDGTLKLESNLGKGTLIHIGLPLTLAIIPCLIVSIRQFRYAVPQINVEELACLYDDEIETKIEKAGNQEVFRLRNTLLPMVRLSEILIPSFRPLSPNSQSLNFAVLCAGDHRFGLIVDKIVGTEEVVVKPMHSALKSINIYAGATVMGDGRVALILDAEGIALHARVSNFSNMLTSQNNRQKNDKELQDVLIFKYGKTEHFAISLPLIQRIEQIKKSDIEYIGEKEFILINGISTKIIRLDQVLNVSSCIEKDEMFLMLPKQMEKPVGLLLSELVDIIQIDTKLNTESYMEHGLLGTLTVLGHMTLFIDINQLYSL